MSEPIFTIIRRLQRQPLAKQVAAIGGLIEQERPRTIRRKELERYYADIRTRQIRSELRGMRKRK